MLIRIKNVAIGTLRIPNRTNPQLVVYRNKKRRAYAAFSSDEAAEAFMKDFIFFVKQAGLEEKRTINQEKKKSAKAKAEAEIDADASADCEEE